MKSKGLLFIVGALVLIAAVGVMLPRVRNVFKGRAAGTAVLSLPAGPMSATVGSQFSVPITLATGGTPVRGVDVVLTFDPSKLQLTGIDDSARIAGNASFKTFVPGVSGATTGILDSASVMTNANSSGRLEIGAVTYDYAANQNSPTFGLTSPYKGTLVLATAKFTPKAGATGSTNIRFDFTTDSTVDSNVIDDLPIQANSPYLNDVLGSVSPTSGLVVNIAGSASPTPATPSLSGVKFKMQAINNSGVAKSVTAYLKNPSGTYVTLPATSVTSGASGVFSLPTLTLTGVTPGSYPVLVKDATHLRKELGVMNIAAGANSAPDWSGVIVKGGDFTNDNVISGNDAAAIISVYTQLEIPVSGGNAVYDLDANGIINVYDVSGMLANYTALNVEGD